MSCCRLQVEQSKTIGWLLYSCRHFQEDRRLVEELSARFKTDIAIYWRKITGFQSKNNIQHALHVEVPTIVAKEAVTFFSRLYGPRTSRNNWPLGIKMHLIPELLNLPEKQKQTCRDLCFRQSQFVQEIQTLTMFSMVSLHNSVIHTKEGKAVEIREAFLDAALPGTQLPIFHSLTINKRGETVLTAFNYSNTYARMIVASPVTYLKFFFDHTSVEACFSDDEIEKSKGETMNPETLEIVTEEANLMMTALELDGYGGRLDSELKGLKEPSVEGNKIPRFEIPDHLRSYTKKHNSSSRSADFKAKDYQSEKSDGKSIQSDGDSTLGESRTHSNSYIKDVSRAISALVIAQLANGGFIPSTQSVPSTSATSGTSSVRITGGPPSGRGLCVRLGEDLILTESRIENSHQIMRIRNGKNLGATHSMTNQLGALD